MKHADEEDVQEWMKEKDDDKKAALIARIRNLGNWLHNSEVMRSGHGDFVITHRPTAEQAVNINVDDYGPCPSCSATLVKREIWKHKCPILKAYPEKRKEGTRRVAKRSQLMKPAPPGVDVLLNTILQSGKSDNISRIVKSDFLILELAKTKSLKSGHDSTQHSHIRSGLRQMARLLIELRRQANKPNASLQEFIKPACFTAVVTAAREVAGFDSKSHVYSTPGLALKIGYEVGKCSTILERMALESGKKDAVESARSFYQLYSKHWASEVSSHALRTLYNNKRNKPKVLPLSEDIVKMSKYLNIQGAYHQKVLEDCSRSESDVRQFSWRRLNEILLVQIILFNRRRQGEASKMTLEEYNNIVHPNGQKVVLDALSKVEMELCRKLFRVEIPGKRGRTVPVLFTRQMKEWLDVLIETRSKSGVISSNKWMFPTSHYGGEGYIRGSDAMRKLSIECGAKMPEALRSTLLRKQIATMMQMLNLQENELDIVAGFLGHDIRVHRAYYRLPEDSLQCAKVAKLLLASERGDSSLSGKTLDDININIDDGIYNSNIFKF
jgi:hypothetical protein